MKEIKILTWRQWFNRCVDLREKPSLTSYEEYVRKQKEKIEAREATVECL